MLRADGQTAGKSSVPSLREKFIPAWACISELLTSVMCHASSPEYPRHHQRELFSPECATVRPGSLIHDDIRMCVAQRVRPPPCVRQKERLLCASNKVCARKRTRHKARRLVTAARRGAEDRTVDMWMPKPESEGQFSACRDAEHRGTLRGQRRGRSPRDEVAFWRDFALAFFTVLPS